MRISRLWIKNFRNLPDVDVPLAKSTVIVGANRTGKSNLLHALRLVLDPTLPNSERQLRREDFSDALAGETDPMTRGEVIEIGIEFVEIENEPVALAALAEALIEGEPMTARLVYRFGPLVDDGDLNHPEVDAEDSDGETEEDVDADALGGEGASATDPAMYRWWVLGGLDEERSLRMETLRFVQMIYLDALRDAVADLVGWRRSPLRSLLERAFEQADADEVTAAIGTITAANEAIVELQPIADLAELINDDLKQMLGDDQAVEIAMGLAPADEARMVRMIRLFTDGERPLADSSLGSLNVLYLLVLLLDLEQRAADKALGHAVLGIEEPEAHLHPHVQRLAFSSLLGKVESGTRSLLVTTHAPHIVSVTPPDRLLILRREGLTTTVFPAASAGLVEREWADLARYLDATRGEIVFARAVILVEGYAEQVLVPLMGRQIDIDLDQRGVSVCPVNGAHFGTYVRFLDAIGTPWVVITDGDPSAAGVSRGQRRAAGLCALLGKPDAEPEDEGIFVGDVTFEIDLVEATDRNRESVLSALQSLPLTGPQRALVDGWQSGQEIERTAVLRILRRHGKGPFAQALAASDAHDLPPYIARALESVRIITDAVSP